MGIEFKETKKKGEEEEEVINTKLRPLSLDGEVLPELISKVRLVGRHAGSSDLNVGAGRPACRQLCCQRWGW